MTPDEIRVSYDVVIPEGATEAEEKAILEEAEKRAIDDIIKGLPGGDFF